MGKKSTIIPDMADIVVNSALKRIKLNALLAYQKDIARQTAEASLHERYCLENEVPIAAVEKAMSKLSFLELIEKEVAQLIDIEKRSVS